MQNTPFTSIDFRTKGRVSFPRAAISAVKGNIVNASVVARKVAISENRVAM